MEEEPLVRAWVPEPFSRAERRTATARVRFSTTLGAIISTTLGAIIITIIITIITTRAGELPSALIPLPVTVPMLVQVLEEGDGGAPFLPLAAPARRRFPPTKASNSTSRGTLKTTKSLRCIP